MKTQINISFVMLCLAIVMAACSREETKSFDAPSESILVSMPGQTGSTTFNSHNITSITSSAAPKGWHIDDIDMYTSTITVTAPSSFDDGEQSDGDITLTGYTPTGNKVSIEIYVAILPNADVDYTASPANCYIANKANTRFRFNPYVGGSSTPLATERVALIWESKINLVQYIDLRDGFASFYLRELSEDGEPTGKVATGNAIIGAYDADDELIWSWHIWVTNSDPEAETITLNGRELMNINLGADGNNEGVTDGREIGNSYGMYYQWGRRTPFIGPKSWDFFSNMDGTMYDGKESELLLKYEASSDEIGNVAWAEDNPMTIILGNKDNDYDWLYASHDDTLWSATTKSEHDPCPAGWRVPDSSIYGSLTIAATDDAMPWEEAQKMYGWWLEDSTTGDSYFFSAAGRRNYIDGRLDNINDDDIRPIPWSGYYWTTTTEGAMAKALYFDLNSTTRTWNGINTSRSMQRANALPIRCVRE